MILAIQSKKEIGNQQQGKRGKRGCQISLEELPGREGNNENNHQEEDICREFSHRGHCTLDSGKKEGAVSFFPSGGTAGFVSTMIKQ
jgi:hypothetical protein